MSNGSRDELFIIAESISSFCKPSPETEFNIELFKEMGPIPAFSKNCETEGAF